MEETERRNTIKKESSVCIRITERQLCIIYREVEADFEPGNEHEISSNEKEKRKPKDEKYKAGKGIEKTKKDTNAISKGGTRLFHINFSFC